MAEPSKGVIGAIIGAVAVIGAAFIARYCGPQPLKQWEEKVVFNGFAKALPTLPHGNGRIVDRSQWPAVVRTIRVDGCGGGGGGSGAGQAGHNKLAPTGAGGAGAAWLTYRFASDGDIPVSFEGDGDGGCGGMLDKSRCPGIKDDRTSDAWGEAGHKGMTVIFGTFKFEGGDGGAAVPSWRGWPYGIPTQQARGGQIAVRGGNGAIGLDATAGDPIGKNSGGKVGQLSLTPGCHGGYPGGGGGASEKGNGGDGGKAGSGCAIWNGAVDDAGRGQDGGACAGGGGGGGAVSGDFGGGNGGKGGPAWLTITVETPKDG
jgi:hypothetical protein